MNYIVYIGKTYIKDLREITLLDLNTCQEWHFLATEEEVRKIAEKENIEVRYKDSYTNKNKK